jgi:hypothetical protein
MTMLFGPSFQLIIENVQRISHLSDNCLVIFNLNEIVTSQPILGKKCLSKLGFEMSHEIFFFIAFSLCNVD